MLFLGFIFVRTILDGFEQATRNRNRLLSLNYRPLSRLIHRRREVLGGLFLPAGE